MFGLRSICLSLAWTLIACGSSGVLAQTPATDNPPPTNRDVDRDQVDRSDQTTPPARLRIQKATDLIGKPVKNPQGERLGEVQDLAIDPERGQVVYAVLSFGGFLGMGEKWFAIPARAMNLPSHAENYVLAVDKERLKNAQGFDKQSWPNMGDPTWATDVHRYYDQPPYWSSTNGSPDRPLRIQKASDLIGKKVVNTQGENLGDIHDLAIDPDRARVAYAVLSFGGVMNLGDKWFAIPWSAFTLPTDARRLTLQIDKEQLKASEGFDKNHWPNMADTTWATGVYTRYGQKPYWTDGCAGCGMATTYWSESGRGYTEGTVVYCCRDCFAGTSCTCVAASRSGQADGNRRKE